MPQDSAMLSKKEQGFNTLCEFRLVLYHYLTVSSAIGLVDTHILVQCLSSYIANQAADGSNDRQSSKNGRTVLDQRIKLTNHSVSQINIRSEFSIKICARHWLNRSRDFHLRHDTTFRKCSISDNS